MADYAASKRCVRAAAGGFSPGGEGSILRRKARPRLHFDFMLEARRRERSKKSPPKDRNRQREKQGTHGGKGRKEKRMI